MNLGATTPPCFDLSDEGIRTKVLICAFACEPGWGSEPEVGWRWATQASQFHDVWVVTHASHRNAVEAELQARPIANFHVTYVDFPAWTTASGLAGIALRMQYVLWQVKAFRVARRLHARVKFDLAHHLTYASLRYPTFVAWLGVPFVWGPLGGGERAPRAFYPVYGREGRLYERLRDLSNAIAMVDPLVHISAARAVRILALTQNTVEMLPGRARGKVSVIPTIAIEPNQPPRERHSGGTSKATRLLYLGRLEYSKGVQLAIPALSKAIAAGADVTLTIVGDGPLEAHLRGLVASLRVNDRIHFTPRVPRHRVPSILAEHDVLIFPSFRDSGGYVVLEAMAESLPVICFELGGPAVTVTPETGIRVPAIDPEQAISDLSRAILQLAGDHALREKMGSAGWARARSVYSWDEIGVYLRALYTDVLKANS